MVEAKILSQHDQRLKLDFLTNLTTSLRETHLRNNLTHKIPEKGTVIKINDH
jgi:hypothetical protein